MSTATLEKGTEQNKSAEELEKEQFQKELDELDAPIKAIFDEPFEEKKDEVPTAEKDPVIADTEKKDEPKLDLQAELEKLRAENARYLRENARLGRVTSELHERIKEMKTQNPDSGDNQNTMIDPDVERTLDAWRKKNGLLTKDEIKQQGVVTREDIYDNDAVRVRTKNSDFDEVVERFFIPEAQKNPDLLAEYQANMINPAEFAYNKGKEIMAKFVPQSNGDMLPKSEVEKLIEKARLEGRNSALSEFTGGKTISSLSSVPGITPKTMEPSNLRKELDEL